LIASHRDCISNRILGWSISVIFDRTAMPSKQPKDAEIRAEKIQKQEMTFSVYQFLFSMSSDNNLILV
jgi:hypothetical protein